MLAKIITTKTIRYLVDVSITPVYRAEFASLAPSPYEYAWIYAVYVVYVISIKVSDNTFYTLFYLLLSE